VIHISTDFVFDGLKDGPYTETDLPNPLSAYGRSKRLGEQLLEQSGCDSCIIRMQWTYGKHGVNFITKLLSAADSRPRLNVVDDQVGSPTHTQEAAEVICRMLRLNTFPRGLYHLAASGYVSRYEMARTLFDMLGKKVEIVPCKTSDFKTAAARPLNSRFDCTKLQTLLGMPFKTWQAMLNDYLESL
jgi:dTDP-4-dehydrorhamnose reductase